MNTRAYMIIIQGEIKTSEIMSCVYNRDIRKWEVEFNNGTVSSYAYSEVEKLTEPDVLNPQMYCISRNGRKFFNIREYMYLGVQESLIGIYVLGMVVKEIIVIASYKLLNRVLLRVSQQMYLNI